MLLFRSLVVLALIVVFSLSASGTPLFSLPDQALQQASVYFRDKDYGRAREAALKAPQSGIREFMIGMTSIRQEQWQDAISPLGYAVDNFPLLGDYALYNQALAFSKLGKHPEALATVNRMLRAYPQSPIRRAAATLQGNELFASGSWKEALASYTDFIEDYPQGADALAAMYRSALCREQLGDPAATAATLRTITINYPASSLTPKALLDLERLAKNGAPSAPLTAAEMLRQGNLLIDLRKYEQAVKTLDGALQKTTDPETAARIKLKKGQALFKWRHYKDAEQLFTSLAKADAGKGIMSEIQFWLARTMARNGKDDDAAKTYLNLADTWPKAILADDALLEAAQIRKSQKRPEESLQLLQRSLVLYPGSSLKKNLLWEIAWERYQARDYKDAADWFGKLAGCEGSRDRALYWRGKALTAAGDQDGAKTAFGQLASEFPLGYYAMTYAREAGTATSDVVAPPVELAEAFPIPAGYERIKTLITLGFYEEAGKELATKKKPKSLQGIARLYLEMGNYNAVIHLYKAERPGKLEKDAALLCGINYPLAYREYVRKNAADTHVPESLVYAIMRAESTYLPTALSPVGAVGLMQLMPKTAAAVAKGSGEKYNLTSPEVNIRFGSKHLKDLIAYHNGDMVKAIAAYNAGSGNVGKWEKRLGNLPREEFIENIPFGETREYVKKVLAGMELYQRFYGLDRKPVETVKTPVEKQVPAPMEKPAEAPAEKTAAAEQPALTPTALQAAK